MNNEFTLDILRTHNKERHDFSVQNNPYFFQAVCVSLLAEYSYLTHGIAFRRPGAPNRSSLRNQPYVKSLRRPSEWFLDN